MADMEARIHRPVAVPQRYLGAPAVPAAINLTFWCTVMLVSFAFPGGMLYGIFSLFALIPVHFWLMYYGTQEPHLSSLIQKQQDMSRTARQIGGSRSKVFRAG